MNLYMSQNVHLKSLIYQVVQVRYFNTQLNVLKWQKISYKTKYGWALNLRKSRMRARYPWIPREPENVFKYDGQTLKFSETNLDFIVPDNLEQCDLRPYVEWRSKIEGEDELTADSLFEKRYRKQITKMFKRKMSDEQIISSINKKIEL